MSTADPLHNTLLRQLRRHGLDSQTLPSDVAGWQALLSRVSNSYNDADEQRYLHDRAFEISSREMSQLYESLRQASESELARQRDRLLAIFDATPSGLIVVDSDLKVVDLNASAEDLLGVPPNESAGNALGALMALDEESCLAAIEAAAVEGNAWSEDDRHLLVNGEKIPVSLQFVPILQADKPAGGVLSLTDQSESRLAQAALAHRATHDELTGLLNRAALMSHLDTALMRSSRSETTCAVFFIDLDRFKYINDTHGHAFGDRVLVAASERLREVIRDQDVLARIGGDEFVIVAEYFAPDAPGHIANVADRILTKLGEPYDLSSSGDASLVSEDTRSYLSASIGVALSGEDASPLDMLRDSDVALYTAKGAGRERWTLFDESMREEISERFHLERQLRHALEVGALHMDFQPIFSMPDLVLLGFEALVRWNNAGTMVSPGVFVPLAEESGLIRSLGAFVLNYGLSFASAIGELPGGQELTVSINFSALQITDPAVVAQIEAALTKHSVAPDRLCVEITETALLKDPLGVYEIIQAIRDLEVGISLDDFGTGYSSLTTLRELPLDQLKIDRSFASLGSSTDEVIVQALAKMGQALGAAVIAEGVEGEDQLNRLRSIGVDGAQGFFLSRPLSWEKALSLAASSLQSAVAPSS